MGLPKYVQLKQQILERIRGGQLLPDDQLPTEHELSETNGISRQTVRQATSELVQEGWLYRVQGKGTFVSSVLPQSRKTAEAPAVGLITTSISDYIFPEIVRGAEAVLRSRGYRLVLSSTDNDKQREKECLELMLAHPLAGVIVEPTRSAQGNPNLDCFLSMNLSGIPYVMINERYPELGAVCVKLDDEQAGFLAAAHLIKLGHTKICGFFKVDDRQGIKRMKGFIRAHQEFENELSPQAVIRYVSEDRKEKPYLEALQLLAAPPLERPTAFVCYNDELAVLLLEAARQCGLKVPEQLSVIGCDDSSLAVATEVKLTTLTHPKEQLGARAAEILLDIVEQSGQNRLEETVIYRPELVIRGSDGPPPIE